MQVSPYVIPGMPTNKMAIGSIKGFICEIYEITPDDLIKKTRKRHIVIARQIAVYVTKKIYPHKSNRIIGEYYGINDPTTVIHAIKKVNDYIDTEPETKEMIERILKQLK